MITLRIRLLKRPKSGVQKNLARIEATTRAKTIAQSADPSGPVAREYNHDPRRETQSPLPHSNACECNTLPHRKVPATRRQWTIALWPFEFRLNVGPLPEPSLVQQLQLASGSSRSHCRHLLALAKEEGDAAKIVCAYLSKSSPGINNSDRQSQ